MSARIRKLLCVLLGAALLCLMLAPAVIADNLNPQPLPPGVIKVDINGSPLQMNVAPAIIAGHTMVAMRAIFEALDTTVQWNPTGHTITATGGTNTIQLMIGSTVATVNGVKITLDAAPTMIDGSTMVPAAFVSKALGAIVGWDATDRQVNICYQPNPLLRPYLEGGPDIKFDSAAVEKLTSKVHGDFHNLVVSQKASVEQAVQQEIQYLQQQPDIQDVTELDGGNLFVHFKGGYPLVMFLNQGSMGGPIGLQSDEPAQLAADQSAITLLNPSQTFINPVIKNPSLLQTKYPGTDNALVFDCLDNDVWAIHHVSTVDVGSDLQSMGYNVTTELNDDASVSNATQFANGNYGVVYVRAHGGVLPGNDWGFLMKPWSSTPMPWASGYTGTWPVSFDSYGGNGNAVTMYGYATSSGFATAYWTKSFPDTMFYLESCEGAESAGVPGLPTWTLDHGAGAWIAYDNSVSFNNGDNGAKLFFSDMAKWDDASTGVSDVEAAGYLPPNLKLLPAGDNYTLNDRITGVTINGPRIVNLKAGATTTLTATVTPSNAYNTAVTWSSDNTGVAKVDPNSGAVTAVAAGYAHITATTVGTWTSGYPSADSITVDVTKSIIIPIAPYHGITKINI